MWHYYIFAIFFNVWLNKTKLLANSLFATYFIEAYEENLASHIFVLGRGRVLE